MNRESEKPKKSRVERLFFVACFWISCGNVFRAIIVLQKKVQKFEKVEAKKFGKTRERFKKYKHK